MDPSDSWKYDPPEVTEADIYVDFAEGEGDTGGQRISSAASSSFPPLLPQTAFPLESGEQCIQLPFSVGNSHASSASLPASNFESRFASSHVAPQGHSSVSRGVTDEADVAQNEEEVDVDTPYDGRLFIQSASRPDHLLKMLSSSGPVAKKSTSKMGSKSKTVAKKSTGGLNKMIPKAMQIAKKSTTKQRSKGKTIVKRNNSSDPSPLPSTLEKSQTRIDASDRCQDPAQSPVGKTQARRGASVYKRMAAISATYGPSLSQLLSSSGDAESPRMSSSAQLISKKSSKEANASCRTRASPKSSILPSPEAALFPKQKSQPSPQPETAAPMPKFQKQGPDPASGLPGHTQKTSGKTALNKTPPKTASLRGVTSPSYRASQKTAHRKGVPEPTQPMPASGKRRRLSEARSETSVPETSEMPSSKKAKLQEAETELNATMALLMEKQELLRSVEEQLATATASLQTMMENKEKMQAQEARVNVCLVSLETASRPFDCEVCIEAFQLAMSCPRAFRQHSKDKAFHCRRCSAAFTHGVLLEKHIDCHSSDRLGQYQASTVKVSTLPASNNSSDSEMELKAETAPILSVHSKLSGDIVKSTQALEKIVEEIVRSKLSSDSPLKSTVHSELITDDACKQKTVSETQSVSPDKQTALSGPKLALIDEQEMRADPKKTVSKENVRAPRASCHICGKTFEWYCYLAKHMKVHTSIYTCAYCRKCFSLKSALSDHTSSEHKGKKISVVCKYCWQPCANIFELERHITTHLRGTGNKCSVCGKQYNWRKNLLRHMQLLHGEQQSLSVLKTMLSQEEFQCVKCGKSFMQATSLVKHDETFHADAQGNPSKQRSQNAQSEAATDGTVCDSSKDLLPSSVPSMSKPNSGQSKAVSGRSASSIRQTANLSRQKIASQLSAHIWQTAQVKGLLTCKLCSSYRGSRIGLRKHIRKIHPEAYNAENCGSTRKGALGLPHKCSSCGLVFMMYKRLVGHMKLFHPGEPIPEEQSVKIKCLICLSCFHEERLLQKHIRSAHPVKKTKNFFKCVLCPKKFQHKANTYRHMRNSHVVFSGPIQSKGSQQTSKTSAGNNAQQRPSDAIKGTMKTKKCQKCGKTFSTNGFLFRHNRKYHSSDSCFQCSDCGLSFANAKGLSEHTCQPQLSVLNEEPEATNVDCRYRCLTCGAGFHIAREWTRHMEEHSDQSNITVNDHDALLDDQGIRDSRLMSPISVTVKTEHLFRCVDCGDTFDEEEAFHGHSCWVKESNASQAGDPSERSTRRASNVAESLGPKNTTAKAGTIQCTICQRVYSHHSIRKHYNTIHRAKFRQCKRCGLIFTNITAYSRHLLGGCQIPETANADSSMDHDTEPEVAHSTTSEEPMTDKNCTGLPVCVSGPVDSNKASPLLLRIKLEPGTLSDSQDPEPVKCTICHKLFSPLHIRKHMKKVHSLHALRCKKCGEEFLNQLEYDEHMLQHKEDEPLADCKQMATSSGSYSGKVKDPIGNVDTSLLNPETEVQQPSTSVSSCDSADNKVIVHANGDPQLLIEEIDLGPAGSLDMSYPEQESMFIESAMAVCSGEPANQMLRTLTAEPSALDFEDVAVQSATVPLNVEVKKSGTKDFFGVENPQGLESALVVPSVPSYSGLVEEPFSDSESGERVLQSNFELLKETPSDTQLPAAQLSGSRFVRPALSFRTAASGAEEVEETAEDVNEYEIYSEQEAGEEMARSPQVHTVDQEYDEAGNDDSAEMAGSSLADQDFELLGSIGGPPEVINSQEMASFPNTCS